MRNNQIDRRTFIKEVVLAAALSCVGVNEFKKMSNRKHQDKVSEIYKTGGDYNILSKTKYKYQIINTSTGKPFDEDNEKKINGKGQGMGIIKNGKYYTCNHCVGANHIKIRTQFGIMQRPIQTSESDTKINNISLEKLVGDSDKDIAVFKLPEYYNHPEIPYEFGEPKLGDKIYVVGNPMLKGTNVREGRIGDINGLEEEKHLFGHDVKLMGGDSGTYVLNDKFEVVGINSRTYGGTLNYAIKMPEFDMFKYEE